MTRRGFGGDPMEALRGADPLDPLEVPEDTTGAHARALFQEVTSMDAPERQAEPRRRQPLLRRLALGVGMAVAVAAVAGGAYALLRDKAEEAVVGGEPIGGGAASICIQYTDQMLLDQEVAFDGTLVSSNADGSQVTFEVHRWFKGGEGTEVTLNAQGLLRDDSLALVGTSLEVGQRYLTSASEGFVWACGFTLTYDTEIANHWADLFGV